MGISFYIGTMGFSYQAWNGVFYPKAMRSKDYLPYYSGIFNSVEIDSTFYGTPRKSTVEKWIKSTPPDFKICLKAPRMITHDIGLANTWGYMYEFIEMTRYLESRLAVILLQFPPSFHVDQIGSLADFLNNLPRDLKFAVEVRHPSWYTAESQFCDLLKQTNVCWAATEYPGLPNRIHLTQDYVYIRWIGQHGSYKYHDSERIDRTEELQDWLKRIENISSQVNAIYGYFNNDYAGFGAGSAIKFRKMIGSQVILPQQLRQGSLF